MDDFVAAVYKTINNKNCYEKILNIGYGKPKKNQRSNKKSIKKLILDIQSMEKF